jgi:hypothetical protein
MLLAQAERDRGIADQLARVIPDERDADRVVHLLLDTGRDLEECALLARSHPP